MRLAQLLFSQGFGTRRACEGLVLGGHVAIGGAVLDDPFAEVDADQGLLFEVRGQRWPYHAKALVLLNKPAGYECSQKPRHHPSVMSLLPPPLRERGVQPIGRLDEDTTGLLLLTDDGALIHRLTSPKKHVPKVYEIACAEPVDERTREALLAGVVLHDDPAPVRAAACELTGATSLRMTLLEGKYHPGQAHGRRHRPLGGRPAPQPLRRAGAARRPEAGRLALARRGASRAGLGRGLASRPCGPCAARRRLHATCGAAAAGAPSAGDLR